MTDPMKIAIAAAFAFVTFATLPCRAAETEAPVPQLKTHPTIGGHFGAGLTIFTVGSEPTTLVGRDTLQIGPVVGVNFGIDEHWSIDLESAALSQWFQKGKAAPGTAYLLDPGVVYNWGPLATGLRLGVRVPNSQAEIGVIPIFVKAFGTGPIKYYAEIDFPMFVGGSTSAHSGGTFSFTTFFQNGVAF